MNNGFSEAADQLSTCLLYTSPLANVYHRSVILELLSTRHRCSGCQVALSVVILPRVLLMQEQVKLPCLSPVSYTHLDVYKRQSIHNVGSCKGVVIIIL